MRTTRRLRKLITNCLEFNRIAYNESDVRQLVTWADSEQTCEQWDRMTPEAQGAWLVLTSRNTPDAGRIVVIAGVR